MPGGARCRKCAKHEHDECELPVHKTSDNEVIRCCCQDHI